MKRELLKQPERSSNGLEFQFDCNFFTPSEISGSTKSPEFLALQKRCWILGLEIQQQPEANTIELQQLAKTIELPSLELWLMMLVVKWWSALTPLRTQTSIFQR